MKEEEVSRENGEHRRSHVKPRERSPVRSRERSKERSRERSRENRPSERDNNKPLGFKVFIGGISRDIDEEELAKLFAKYKPEECVVMRELVTKRPRGFGFVTFSSRKDMEYAINDMHNKRVHGRVVTVSRARPLSEMRSRYYERFDRNRIDPRGDRRALGGGAAAEYSGYRERRFSDHIRNDRYNGVRVEPVEPYIQDAYPPYPPDSYHNWNDYDYPDGIDNCRDARGDPAEFENRRRGGYVPTGQDYYGYHNDNRHDTTGPDHYGGGLPYRGTDVPIDHKHIFPRERRGGGSGGGCSSPKWRSPPPRDVQRSSRYPYARQTEVPRVDGGNRASYAPIRKRDEPVGRRSYHPYRRHPNRRS